MQIRIREKGTESESVRCENFCMAQCSHLLSTPKSESIPESGNSIVFTQSSEIGYSNLLVCRPGLNLTGVCFPLKVRRSTAQLR